MALEHSKDPGTEHNSLNQSSNNDIVIELRGMTDNPNTAVILSPLLQQAQEANPEWLLEESKEIDEDRYQTIVGRVLQDLSQLPHAYHNVEHTRTVLGRVEKLASQSSLDASQTRMVQLAALFHDYGHAGQTFRQEVIGVDRSDLSNEEYAAIIADEMLGEYLSVPQRVQLQGLILATTFGQQNAAAIPDASYLRDYTPTTSLEKLLSFADINSLEDSMSDWMRENFAVLEESATIPITQSFDDYLEGRLKFLDYMKSKLESVESMLTEEYRNVLAEALEARVEALNDYLSKESVEKQGYRQQYSNLLQKVNS